MGKLKSIWLFFQNQVLGLKWINKLIGNLLNTIGVDINSKVGGSIQFFVYDVIKIFILLSILIFIISYIQSYFPPERTKKIIGKYKGIGSNCLAALLGTVTPFCSCSSIPLFIGFTSAGLPIGTTFSFLISSPLVDLGSLILLMSIFGTKIAVVYVVLGLILAVVGGTIIGKLNMEKYLEDVVVNAKFNNTNNISLSKKDRIDYAREQVVATVKKVFWYVIIGVGIGAIIHNWIPETFIKNILGKENYFSVILASVLGIPMYADIFGAIPIAEALVYRGAAIGTVLSFMMGVTALSLPSMIMLRKAIKPRLLALFIFIVTIGIIIVGYIFNIFQYLFI